MRFSWAQKHAGFTSITLREGSWTRITYPHVEQESAEALFRTHQNGNRGPMPIALYGGGRVSVDTAKFSIIEIGTSRADRVIQRVT